MEIVDKHTKFFFYLFIRFPMSTWWVLLLDGTIGILLDILCEVVFNYLFCFDVFELGGWGTTRICRY